MNNKSYGVGILTVIGVVFTILRLVHVISWSWWLVLLPFIIQAVILIVILLMVIAVLLSKS